MVADAVKLTYEWIEQRIKMTIDQFYAGRKYRARMVSAAEEQLHFIGGVLQTALHLLPNDRYFELKRYIWETYRYDPGGCADRQMSIFEIMGSE